MGRRLFSLSDFVPTKAATWSSLYRGLRRSVNVVPVDDEVGKQRLYSLLRKSFRKGVHAGEGGQLPPNKSYGIHEVKEPSTRAQCEHCIVSYFPTQY